MRERHDDFVAKRRLNVLTGEHHGSLGPRPIPLLVRHDLRPIIGESVFLGRAPRVIDRTLIGPRHVNLTECHARELALLPAHCAPVDPPQNPLQNEIVVLLVKELLDVSCHVQWLHIEELSLDLFLA